MKCYSYIFLVKCCLAADILYLTPIVTKSHNNFYVGLAHILAKEHNLTLVTNIGQEAKHCNIREILISGKNISESLSNVFKFGGTKRFVDLAFNAPKICKNTLTNLMKTGIDKERFDLIFLSFPLSECVLPWVYKFGIPYIYLYPNQISGAMWYGTAVGLPELTSTTQTRVLDMAFPYTFLQRLYLTTYSVIVYNFLQYMIGKRSFDAGCSIEGMCNRSTPAITDIHSRSSLMFTNSIDGLDYPPAMSLPNVVNVGGLHCRPAQPLPKELDEWIGNREFIYFSLGSIVKSSDMPDEYLDIFVDVFASLPYVVLWKWDEEVHKTSSNVRIAKWLPQQDILGDKRVRLFMSHGGLFSIQEASYHSVPILCLPIFSDQQANCACASEHYYGNRIPWKHLSVKALTDAIMNTIRDERIGRHVSYRSMLFIDRPSTAVQVILFWTAYVLRHNGARHLTSPLAHMKWYEVYNVDVYAVLVLILVMCGVISFYTIKKAVLFLFCKGKRKKKQD